MLKFKHFQTLLKELHLFEEYMPKLLSKGFDEWEVMQELNESLLSEELGKPLFEHNNKNNNLKILKILNNQYQKVLPIQ